MASSVPTANSTIDSGGDSNNKKNMNKTERRDPKRQLSFSIVVAAGEGGGLRFRHAIDGKISIARAHGMIRHKKADTASHMPRRIGQRFSLASVPLG